MTFHAKCTVAWRTFDELLVEVVIVTVVSVAKMALQADIVSLLV
jgi:hypothetical protein